MRRRAAIAVALILLVVAGWMLAPGDERRPAPAPPPPSEPLPAPGPVVAVQERPAVEAAPPVRSEKVAPKPPSRDGKILVSASQGAAPALVRLTVDGRTKRAFTGRADGAGRRSVDVRPAVPGMEIGIAAKGFRPATVTLSEPDLTAEVVLEALASLSVYGGRIGIAEVVLGFEEEEHPLKLPGRVSFEDLEPGERELIVSAPPRLVLARHRVRLVPGERSRIDLGSLDLGVRVTGTTVDEKGRPVPNALVLAPTEGMPTGYEISEAQARSNREGVFEMRLVPGLRYRFRAEKEGYGCNEQPEIHVTAEGAPEVRVVLSGAIVIRGRVVDPGGRPIAGVSVTTQRIFEKSGTHIERHRAVPVTDEQGRFEMTDLPAGGKFRIVAKNEGYGQDTDHVFLAAPGQPEIVVVLHPERAIEVHVLDQATGKPVSTANVQGGQGHFQFTMAKLAPGRWRLAGFTGTADEKGRFRLRHLQPGRTYRVSADHFPFSGTPLQSEITTFRADPEAPLRIVVKVTGRITARLALPKGAANRWPPSVRILPADVEDPPYHSVGGNLANDPDRVHSDPLPPGVYRVTISAFPYPPVTIENVEVTAKKKTDLGVIGIPAGVRLVLHLSDSAGRSFEDYRVKLIGADGRVQRLSTMRHGGEITLRRVLPGRWRIVATLKKGGPEHDLGEITLSEGRDVEIERAIP
jgi:protocatechuate 3,4-dioxygenase beta subunit